MKQTERRELVILEQIAENGHVTQRSIAKRINAALGLCNPYIKRLVEKGYVMVSTMPRHRLYYNLTPKGIAEKSRLTLLYMRDSLDFYRKVRKTITETIVGLKKEGSTKIVLLGAGELAEITYILAKDHDMEVVAVTETAPEKSHFFGLKVFGLDRLEKGDFDAIIVTEELEDNSDQLARIVQKMNIPIEKMVLFTGHRMRLSTRFELEPPEKNQGNDREKH